MTTTAPDTEQLPDDPSTAGHVISPTCREPGSRA